MLRAIAENSISLEKLTKEVDQLKSLLLRVLENSTSTATNIIDLPDDIVLPMCTLADVDSCQCRHHGGEVGYENVSPWQVDRTRSRQSVGGPTQRMVVGHTQRMVGGPTQRMVGGPTQRMVGGPTQRMVGGPTQRMVGGPTQRMVGGPTQRMVVGPTQRMVGGPTQRMVGGPIQRMVGGPIQRMVPPNAWSHTTHGPIQRMVPYNPSSILQLNCRVKVEMCSSIKAIKYVLKYFVSPI